MADLRLAAEERPVVAEMLAAVPAGAARLENLKNDGYEGEDSWPLADSDAEDRPWWKLAGTDSLSVVLSVVSTEAVRTPAGTDCGHGDRPGSRPGRS